MTFDSDWQGGPSRCRGRHRRKRLAGRMVWRMLWRRSRRTGRGTQAPVSGRRRESGSEDNDATASLETPERVLYLAWSADNHAQQQALAARQGTLRRVDTGRG